MSTHRFRWTDRRAADQELRDALGTGRPAAPDALGELLRAAARPAREGELAGEQAAVAAFRVADLNRAAAFRAANPDHPAPRPRRLTMLKTTLASLLTAKVLAPAAALAAAGGITLATATGALPTPDETPAGPPSEVTTTPRSPESMPSGKPDMPSSALPGLCQAYTAGAGAEHGKALDSPAFQALAAEAGGADKVSGFCDNVLADRPGKPSDVPAPPHSTGSPTALPPSAPDGVPAHPTGSPTERPSGAPTTVPSTPDHPTGSPESIPGR